MRKKLLTAIMILLLLCAGVIAASATDTGPVDPNKICQQLTTSGLTDSVCPYCGVQPEGGWTALDTDITAWQRLNGHYIVRSALNNASYYAVLAGDSACVFLNGQEITTTDSYAFQVEGGTLTVMGSATVTGDFKSGSSVGATIDVVSGTLNLCGGTYRKSTGSSNAVVAVRGDGCTVNMYNGTAIEEGNSYHYEGGNVRLTANATFNMYGGTIRAGQAYCGGNVYVNSAGAQFNMYGGAILDGKAQLADGSLYNDEQQYALGGNICVLKGNFTQSQPAAVTGGTAYTGGNLYYSSGNTVTLAGTVSGGSGYTAGNIDLRAGSKLILPAGALVSGGNARYDGGNIQLYNATLELSGGTFTGGTAGRYGGSVMADGSDCVVTVLDGKISGGESTGSCGGNLYLDNGAQLALSGGTVTGGKAGHATQGRGGNIYIGDATVQITGGAITMGAAYVSGGNLHIQECTQGVALQNCQIEHGQAAAGGNICSIGTDLQLAATTSVTDGVSAYPRGASFAGGGGNVFIQGGEVWIQGQVTGGDANLTGGNLEVRSATVYVADGAVVSDGTADYDGGNILVTNKGILVITDAAVSGGTAGRQGNSIYSDGTVVLEKTAVAQDHGGVYVGAGGGLRVYASFDGNVAISGLEIPAPVYGVTLNENRFTSTGSFSGKLWITELPDSPLLFGKDQKLVVGAVYTSKSGVKTWYADNAAAVAGYGEADYLVPYGDLVLTGGNYVVDLAGQNLKLTGSGRVTCFDSSNDAFDTCGSALFDGPIMMNQLAQKVADKYYVRVWTNGAYSFHRLALHISDVSLRISSGGIYYSAQWECDDVLIPLIQGFGIGVSLADMPTESLRFDSDTKYTYHPRSEFASGIKKNGVLIRDILQEQASAGDDRAEKNSTYGKMPIYAKAYAILDNGVDRVQTIISTDSIAISMHDVLYSIEQNMPHYYGSAQSLQNFKQHWAQNGLVGEEWDFDFTVPVELLQLQQAYADTQRLTGQLHDRLDTAADLQLWKQQMEANGIDFAACPEKGTITYIDSAAWDSADFVGGAEARFTVDGKTLDCTMLFATRQAMEAVLTQSGAFTYTDGIFQTKPVDTAAFTALIDAVRAQGGLFLLAHPKDMGLIDSEDAMDYWFTDGVAVDIGTNEQNYKLWTDLLAEGKRLWAVCANAGNLSGKADGVTLYTRQKNAQAILGRLTSGDVTCGSLGITMAVGDARMGGTSSFSEKKLVFSVDHAPAGVLQAGHTYRIDLITNSAVKASWPYTGRAVYEILDADEKQAFYRLEVVDETTGQRIAVGNPIWNKDYGLKVGFARENITPDYTVLIVGGKSRASKGVLDNDGIFLTCVAMQEGEQTYLVFTADFINADSSGYTATLKAAVSTATGIPGGNIRFSTTHAHSSVGVSTTDWSLLGADGEANRQRFLEELNDAAAETANNAILDLSAVEAAYAGSVTDKKDVAFVRHYVKKNGTLDYSNDGGYDTGSNWFTSLNAQYKAHATQADQEIQMVKFQRSGGKKDVLLMSVPAHATLNENSQYLSADFPNYARTYIEDNSDSLVAYFIGAAGDQVPRSKLSPYYLNQTMGVTNNTDAAVYGQKLGEYAVSALDSLTQLRSTAMKSTVTTFAGTVGTNHFDSYETALSLVQRYDAGEDVSAALKNAGFAGIYDARMTVRRYEYVQRYGQTMDMRCVVMAVGDVAFVFAPYEMAGVNGSQIKSGSAYATTFLATCSDDSVSYVASQDAFDHASYEAQNTWFKPGSGELLAKHFVDALQQQKYNLH